MNFEVEKTTGLMLHLMRKREPLRSDLWAYLHHGDGTSDGLDLKHPLVHLAGVKPDGAAWINHLVQSAEEAAEKALAEERWLDYVLLHEPPYRVAVFAKLARKLPHAVYWRSLGEVYIYTENIWQRKRLLANLFAADRPHRKQLMSAYERRYLASLPNRLTIFQGLQPRQVQGWSWTLDEKKATGIAKQILRLGFGPPKVATGKAKKSDVIAYFSRRKEKEIIIDPSKVKIMQIRRVEKMSLYVQYHNSDKEGLESLFSSDGQSSIFTRRPEVRHAQGIVFLIVGVGRPRRYYLWDSFDIEGVEEKIGGTFICYGPGRQLCPPQWLDGKNFEAFKDACANFVGFRRIDDQPFSLELKKLAQRFRGRPTKKVMEPFLQDLLKLLKKGTEDYETVLAELGHDGQESAAIERSQTPKRATQKITPKRTKQSVRADQDGESTKSLRALSIRQPHAEAIFRGIKKIEFRSKPTTIRGRVQIYASLRRYSTKDEAERLKKYGIEDVSCDDLPRGVLIGTVEVCDCTKKFGEYEWHLRNPERAARLLKPRKQPQPVWFNPF